MSQACIILLVLFKFVTVYGYAGKTVMFYSPNDMRSVDRYPFTPQFQENRSTYRQHQTIHSNQQPPQPMTPNREDITFDDFVDAFNEVKESYQKEQERLQSRTAGHVEGDNNGSAYRPYPETYPRPTAPAYGHAPTYQNSSPIARLIPPAPELPKLPLLKPDLSTLLKPVSTKVSSKVSGLLGLILALFSGSSADGLEMNGLKDLVINGIVKPLLVAKGGIKSLISKLIVPLISLLLINLEVLITVWWLWDDCDVKKTTIPSYSYPKPAYNYNNYNSYR